MRALVLSPGKLTVAYWNKQRMRYISPISLYIFISAVHFLLTHFIFSYQEQQVFSTIKKNHLAEATKPQAMPLSHGQVSKAGRVLLKIQSNPEILKPILAKIDENTPRVFFFFIPFTAFLLQLLFNRRKDLYFVDHIIFSLHAHSFYFFIGILVAPFSLYRPMILLNFAGILLIIIYFVKAIRNAYGIGTGRAVSYTLTVGAVYTAVSVSLIFFYVYMLISNTPGFL